VSVSSTRKQLEEAEAAWAARPWDVQRQRWRDEARAQLTRVQKQAELMTRADVFAAVAKEDGCRWLFGPSKWGWHCPQRARRER
jgi:hypothetical protein